MRNKMHICGTTFYDTGKLGSRGRDRRRHHLRNDPSAAAGTGPPQAKGSYVVRKNEKGHNFDRDTETCMRCGMTVREYEDHGKPPCRGNKGERSTRSSRR